MKKGVCLFLLIVLGFGAVACDSPVTIEKPPEGSPPFVRISSNNYSKSNVIHSFMSLAEGQRVSEWSLSNQKIYVDSAVKQANELKLDGENLEEILSKLLSHIDQLDFKLPYLNPRP